MRAERFPLGAGVTVVGLEGDPHSLLARLRAREPVSWLPAVDGWLVTRRDHGPVTVAIRVEAVGRSSVTVSHEIVRADGAVAADGRSVLVAWDREARRSRLLTDAERAALA